VIRALRCADCRELLGGYVLHALGPRRDRRRALPPAALRPLRAEHGELNALPAMLDLAGSADAVPERPPAALEEAVLDRIAREGADHVARRRWRPRRPFAPRMSLRGLRARPLATAAAGAVVGAARRWALWWPRTAARAARRVRSPSAPRRIRPRSGRRPPAPHASAAATLVTFSAGTRVHLMVHGLPAGAVYELWCLRNDGARVSAGTFRVDGAVRRTYNSPPRPRRTSTTARGRAPPVGHRLAEARRPRARGGDRLLTA